MNQIKNRYPCSISMNLFSSHLTAQSGVLRCGSDVQFLVSRSRVSFSFSFRNVFTSAIFSGARLDTDSSWRDVIVSLPITFPLLFENILYLATFLFIFGNEFSFFPLMCSLECLLIMKFSNSGLYL